MGVKTVKKKIYMYNSVNLRSFDDVRKLLHSFTGVTWDGKGQNLSNIFTT
jgi:hypothetical protein